MCGRCQEGKGKELIGVRKCEKHATSLHFHLPFSLPFRCVPCRLENLMTRPIMLSAAGLKIISLQ